MRRCRDKEPRGKFAYEAKKENKALNRKRKRILGKAKELEKKKKLKVWAKYLADS